VAAIAVQLAARPAAEWLAALEAGQVPCGPINNLSQVFDDPQIRHRGMVSTLPHPLAGEVRTVSNPVRFSATPARADRAPPLLGEHTDEILAGLLGLGSDELKDLRASGVI
jgi:crotonobetainyl-CoA:carnitine CoA-transferase CaiB-like acyl-CoA transferase